MEVKHLDTSWDFKKENTKTYTHCFHNYPAMMIPQIANKLLDNYGKNTHLLFDPYCGTGTSLVEANLRGINAIGTDLNPLARLIAEVKTIILNIQTLNLYLKDFIDTLFVYRFGITKNKSIILPNFKNIDYWFSKDVQIRLAVIKEYIQNIDDKTIKNFFNVAFSETIRESSWTKNSEFKLIRMSEKQRNKFNPDVFGIMEFKLSRNKNGLLSYIEAKKNNSKSSIYSFNTINTIPKKIIQDNTVDIVVTSPPYGDSRTTVAYGQFSRFANQWLDNEEAMSLDSNLMGGRKAEDAYIFKIDILNDTIFTIKQKDENRYKDVVAFYKEYEKSIKNISRVLKKNGFSCFVVGNRTVKGITIPTDEITKKLFENNNFKHIETIIRSIPNKRMPSKNSPSNIKGEISKTMNNEYIVICQKM